MIRSKGSAVVTVVRWSGREAHALRKALRLSVRAFADHTDLGATTIVDMEGKGDQAQLRHTTQKILDDALSNASDDARERFGVLVGADVFQPPPANAARRVPESDTASAVDDLALGRRSARTWPKTLLDRPERASADDEDVNRRALLAAGGAVAAGAALPTSTRILQALGVVALDGADQIGAALDCLDELIDHYADMVCRLPSVELYDELVNVRSHAGSLLDRAGGRYRDVTVTSGWLSNLLAVSASYLSDHTAALVWCRDAERRGKEASHPELSGWAALTRAMIAYYEGRTEASVASAVLGQQIAPAGTVVNAKLAAHEMRGKAMLGDADGMAEAKRSADAAVTALPSEIPRTGTFSLTPAEDPPYTATSLLLVGQFTNAASAAERVLDIGRSEAGHHQSRQTSNHARALLILALAEAGRGHLAEAAAAGQNALSCAKPVWPTMVLAGKLDQVLTTGFTGTAEADEYHRQYADIVDQVPGHVPRSTPHSEER